MVVLLGEGLRFVGKEEGSLERWWPSLVIFLASRKQKVEG